MAKFVKVPKFEIYDEETGQWAKPEMWWTDGVLIYHSNIERKPGHPYRIVVPDHYETDLASIPRFPPLLRSLFLKNGHHRIAAVVHDYLCGLGKEFPRRVADKIFLEAMKLRGVKRWHRRLMYFAVRLNTERLILIGRAV